MDDYRQPTTRLGEGGTCDDAGGLEQPDGTVGLLAAIMKGITSDMDWSLLENAICVLTLAKEEEMNESDRAAIQCALIKAYLTRFCCLGWVEDHETVESLVGEDSVPIELMCARWVNPWKWANPGSVEFALEQISSLRQSIDRGRLDTAICVGCTTLESGEPTGNGDRGILTMLGKALVMRYIHGGLLADLNEGVARLRDVAQRTGLGGPWVYICVLSLKNVAWLRVTEIRNFEALRELEAWRAVAKQEEKEGRDSLIHGTEMLERGELDSAIRLLSFSLFCRAAPHPRRAATLNNLANALSTRFGKKGNFGDLEESIRLSRELLDLHPAQHPHRSSSLNSLGIALFTRFEQKGNFGDLEECIRLNRESLDLHPAQHPHRSSSLNNLASALSTRFQQRGNFADLEECIRLHREALHSFPAQHPHRSLSLNNLANSLATRFQQKGIFGDLEECIRLHREALHLFPAQHPHRSMSLNNLASALFTRFEQKGNFGDLEECIRLNRESLDLHPAQHPHRSWSLNNLASALFIRFQQRGNFGDLEECIHLHREALHLFPAQHPHRSSSLTNLASALFARFEQKGNFGDLEECICLHRESLDLRAAQHPHRSSSLNNLASALSTRFQQKGTFGDLEECIRLHRESLALRAAPHPDRSSSLNNLAKAFQLHYLHTKDHTHLDKALDLCEAASKYPTGSLLERLTSSQTWASLSRTHRPQSALLAYDYAISLLPLLSSIDLTLSQRQNVLVHAKEIVSDAVQCAIKDGKLNDAVVFLSTARSVFWSQALQLRSPLDRLESADLTLAQELRKVSRRLEQATHQDSGNGFPPHTIKHGAQEDLHSLAKQREELIEKARKLDGFEDFLRPPSFDSISRAAINGHIIFLNASRYSCNAVVLCPGGSVQHVSLETVDLALVQKLNRAIQQLAQRTCVRAEIATVIEGLLDHGPDRLKAIRKGEPSIDDHFENLLGVLWTAVVKPIVDCLELTKTESLPRVWWCPTGPFSFLPIHAAGIYSKGVVSECFSEYAVSSYCYTPQDLLSPPPEPTSDFRFLAVVEPFGISRRDDLPATKLELEKIREAIPSTATLIEHIGLKGLPTNSEAVLNDIRRCSIAHFGCHGCQDPSDPLKSRLVLSGGDLTMGRMIRECQASNAPLAYLSACETAQSDKERPNEALTLAATMMFAGFRGVVGTMWSIADQDAPIVAEEFYRHLFRHGAERPPVPTDAAYALHLAVKKLRDEGKSFWNWVSYVHFGI